MVKETLKSYVTSIVIMGAVGLNAEEKVVLPPSWTTTRHIRYTVEGVG